MFDFYYEKRVRTMNYIQIELTQGNINQGHFYLDDCRQFFPSECLGGKNKSLAGKPLTVVFDGTGETVSTDIDATKRLFRVARGQSKRFLKHYELTAGDSIYVVNSDQTYLVTTKLSK